MENSDLSRPLEPIPMAEPADAVAPSSGMKPAHNADKQSTALSTTLGADKERTSVFTSLVREDGDIAGLVAYSIYKQNKLDWLQAFEAAKMREPNEAELAAYLIGESTPRRLTTYRHLAETTLAETGPATPGRSASTRDRKGVGPVKSNVLALYGVIAALLVAALWIAAHYTLSSR